MENSYVREDKRLEGLDNINRFKFNFNSNSNLFFISSQIEMVIIPYTNAIYKVCLDIVNLFKLGNGDLVLVIFLWSQLPKKYHLLHKVI